MKRTILTIAAVALIALGIIGLVSHSNQKAKPKTMTPCSTAASPCIELLDNNGKSTGIRFNDFRFGPQGCIYYRMTTADNWQERCGGYEMKWIGPGVAPGVKAQI